MTLHSATPTKPVASPTLLTRLLLLALAALLLLGAAVRLAAGVDPQEAAQAAELERWDLSPAGAAAHMQARLRSNPDDIYAYAQLGLALLQQARESGDSAFYLRAGAAFEAALERDPQWLDALVGQGALALALHQFDDALGWAERAQAINPYRADVRGIRVDALVEMGRYAEAVAAAQEMVDLRPDVQSYSRVAYLRELHGDVAGALAAMQDAAQAARPGSEEWLWTTTQIGNLHWGRHELAQAEEAYRAALTMRPDYPYALAGLGRVEAAQGEWDAAAAIYAPLVERLPLPEFAVALGEAYEAAGRSAAAQEQYELARAIFALNAAAGMAVDLEAALVEADHGDPAAAVAQARAAYAARPTIYAADTLAWTLHRAGQSEQAAAYSAAALRLGTRDARLHYHAGMIALARKDADNARRHLSAAPAINPAFSPLEAPVARAALAALDRGADVADMPVASPTDR